MIAFVVPVNGRLELATACLRQLRRVCDQLGDASAVLAGHEPYFEQLADDLAFTWIYSPNEPLGRKWNDGYLAAALKLEADFFVPVGSDDVIHPSLFEKLPDGDQIGCTRHSAMVDPTGQRLMTLNITYPGGDGVRIFTRQLLEQVMFRPAFDDRARAVDGSITQHLQRTGREPHFDYRETDPFAIIDFKTATVDQRNTFQSCLTFAVEERFDVFETVAEWHGQEFARDVAVVYGHQLVTV